MEDFLNYENSAFQNPPLHALSSILNRFKKRFSFDYFAFKKECMYQPYVAEIRNNHEK